MSLDRRLQVLEKQGSSSSSSSSSVSAAASARPAMSVSLLSSVQNLARKAVVKGWFGNPSHGWRTKSQKTIYWGWAPSEDAREILKNEDKNLMEIAMKQEPPYGNADVRE